MEQQNDNNCIDCVMKRLKDEKITPKPKWTFLFHDYSVLAISLSALIVGTLSFGVFLQTFLSNDFDIYPQVGRTFFEHFFKTFPFLWLIFLIAFIAYATYAFSSSEKGYRYKQSMVIALSIVTSLTLGELIYLTGVAEKIDDFLIETVPRYHEVTGNHVCLWINPDHGLLAGMIVSTGTEPIIIVDFEGNRWEATGTPRFPNDVQNRPGEKVKILGTALPEHVFRIKELRHWAGAVEPEPCR